MSGWNLTQSVDIFLTLQRARLRIISERARRVKMSKVEKAIVPVLPDVWLRYLRGDSDEEVAEIITNAISKKYAIIEKEKAFLALDFLWDLLAEWAWKRDTTPSNNREIAELEELIKFIKKELEKCPE